MKKLFLAFFMLSLLLSCTTKTNVRDTEVSTHIIPTPSKVQSLGKSLSLTTNSKVYSTNDKLKPLLVLFLNELNTLTDFNVSISDTKTGDIVFEIDSLIDTNQYKIHIENHIKVTAGSYQAAAMAKASLLQMVHVENNEVLFPRVSIVDKPDASYRGLMIDLARNWHSVANIKKLIDLAAYYKTNYVQLHFTDDQSYTLPSRKYPKLSTPEKSYSFEDLAELENYAQKRGITIIPEIDIPGHASSLVAAYPELFGISAFNENPYIINMGKESVYTALNEILSEIIPIFKSSPYFHIGGDEARFEKVMDDPDVKNYMKVNSLGDRDVHELYRHFLVRMNETIKTYGKQTCVWEGFAKEGNVKIPKDIIVFEFESLYHLPNELVEDGRTVVNASWKPLYVVNEKKWEPKTIYEWNMWRFQNWWSASPAIVPIQLTETPLIIGAQMCTWEQQEELEFVSLRKRLPVMNERIWNTQNLISFEKFMENLEYTDTKLSTLVNDSKQDTLLIGHNYKEPIQ